MAVWNMVGQLPHCPTAFAVGCFQLFLIQAGDGLAEPGWEDGNLLQMVFSALGSWCGIG